jgi:HNH endonuclease
LPETSRAQGPLTARPAILHRRRSPSSRSKVCPAMPATLIQVADRVEISFARLARRHETIPTLDHLAPRMNHDTISQELIDAQGWYPDTARVAARAGFRCEYCDRDLLKSVDDYEAFQIDHVWPRSRSCPEGLEVDGVGNKALACRPCNFFKGVMEPRGACRESRVKSARLYVAQRRLARDQELQRVRKVANREAPESGG